MLMVPRLFGTNGIRGVAGTEIDAGLAFRVGSALGTLLPKQRVLIGRDGRLSSPMLLEGVAAGVFSRGGGGGGSGFVTAPPLGLIGKKKWSSARGGGSRRPTPPQNKRNKDSALVGVKNTPL